MKTKWTHIHILLLTIAFSGLDLAPANPTSISSTIDRFVANLSMKANHYYWIINDTTTPTKNELIIDINTVITKKAGDQPDESRFLLLLVNGELFGAQKIPLGAHVDCGDEVV